MPLTLTRSFLTVLIPGFVGAAPWLLLFLLREPTVEGWYQSHQLAFHAVAFAIVVILGSIFEEIGNYLEKLWDKKVSKNGPPDLESGWVADDWRKYLCSSHGGNEPVGYRYLSRKVTSFYFELGMMFAVPIALFGISALFSGVAWYWGVVIGVLAALSFFLFKKFAKDTHCVLCETRHTLMNSLSNDSAQ